MRFTLFLDGHVRGICQTFMQDPDPAALAAQPIPDSFRQVCECEFCRRGESTHHDDSHDHSLRYQFQFRQEHPNFLAGKLTLVNGCTKCARVTAWYLEGMNIIASTFDSKRPCTSKSPFKNPKLFSSSACSAAEVCFTMTFVMFSDHAELVHGRRVIELGAGTGLVAMAAAVMGAESSLLTDQVFWLCVDYQESDTLFLNE